MNESGRDGGKTDAGKMRYDWDMYVLEVVSEGDLSIEC